MQAPCYSLSVSRGASSLVFLPHCQRAPTRLFCFWTQRETVLARAKSAKKTNGGPLGYEAELWGMADALRNNMDAAEYKHFVWGLIFLRVSTGI